MIAIPLLSHQRYPFYPEHQQWFALNLLLELEFRVVHESGYNLTRDDVVLAPADI